MSTVHRIPVKERLVRAATELIEQDGYAAASVVAIAQRADVATGALYRHFPSKAELFVTVFRSAAARELAAMRAAAAREHRFDQRFQAVIMTYATRAIENRRAAWALVYEPVDPLVDVERLTYRREFCRGMAQLLREGVTAGEIPEQDTDLSAAAVVGAIAEALVSPVSPVGGETTSGSDIVAAIVEFCGRAIGLETSSEHR
ncbi:MAG TPA: TetR/AcrR family transcriptional regulator [Mycobacterium sp.]|nr:TetR/AcrR family transcriptional regulator [Mycobacterium sp.]